MIEIYFIILAVYAFLILGLWLKEYSIAAISSIGLIVLGVYGIINGIGDYNNIFVYAFSVVSIGLGAYVLIRGALELIQMYYE